MSTPEFNEREQVLALYPSSSCFYRATVIAPPSQVYHSNKNKSFPGYYLLQFDDDGGMERPVDGRMVLRCPKK
jgi:hypothetical protein